MFFKIYFRAFYIFRVKFASISKDEVVKFDENSRCIASKRVKFGLQIGTLRKRSHDFA